MGGMESDVWSIGVIAYAMFMCEPLYDQFDDPNDDEIDATLENIKDPTYLDDKLSLEPFKSRVSECGQDLLRRMLSHDLSKRITPKQALKLPFITEAFDSHDHNKETATIHIDQRFAHLFDNSCVERMA